MSAAEIKAKSDAESRAKSIMTRELGYEYQTSYQNCLLLDGNMCTGYVHAYLLKKANFKKLTSSAKLSVVLELAECDLFGLRIFFSNEDVNIF